MKTNHIKQHFAFPGFRSPNYTQVPDELFDILLPDLTGAELKVLLYIIRRTFGFKKDSDTISLSQMLMGIKKKDGDTQDRGVGLSKVALLHGLRSLADKHLIVTERRQSEEKGNEATNYRLNIIGASPSGDTHSNIENEHPLVKKVYQGVGKKSIPSPWYKNLTTQETVLQKTDKQQQYVVASKTSSPDTTMNGGGEEITNEIAEALTTFGISKLATRQLIQKYPEDYLLSKLDLAQFLVDKKSRLVAHNPAGYLRKSIEEDYNPPKGYKSNAQREAEARERSERERQETEERRRLEQDAHGERAALQTHLDEQYPPTPIPGTDFTTRTAWHAVRGYLRQSLPEFQYGLLEDTMLVVVERGTAVIGTTNRFLCQYLAGRLRSKLEQAFKIILKQPLRPQFRVLTSTLREAPSH